MRTRVDEMFGAFSDHTRLRALHLLLHQELCVAGLVESLRLPQPRVSQHLRVLRAAGLVQERRAGKWRFYSLARPRGSFHAQILRCLRVCHQEVKVLRRDCARMERMLEAAGEPLSRSRRIALPPPRRR
jgi:ArsR family transcriptional regulator